MIKKILISLTILQILVGCAEPLGVPEAHFQLSSESRLPTWLEVPKGYKRDDIDVVIETYPVYIPFLTKPKAVIKVENRASGNVLVTVIGVLRTHPITEEKGYGNYPTYDIITVNHIDEIFEHRAPGNILYITDNPEILKAIRK
jgi:hypothetical protein